MYQYGIALIPVFQGITGQVPRAIMATFITEPQAGDFVLASQRINTLDFTQAIVQRSHKHTVGRSEVDAGFEETLFGYLRHDSNQLAALLRTP